MTLLQVLCQSDGVEVLKYLGHARVHHSSSVLLRDKALAGLQLVRVQRLLGGGGQSSHMVSLIQINNIKEMQLCVRMSTEGKTNVYRGSMYPLGNGD